MFSGSMVSDIRYVLAVAALMGVGSSANAGAAVARRATEVASTRNGVIMLNIGVAEGVVR